MTAPLEVQITTRSTRVVVHRLQRIAAEIYQLMWDQRNFLIRVTRFIARETGITQFLDCGAGLPTAENTHQVAQAIQPNARVVYIDNDPTVLTHGRALIANNHHAHFSAVDLFNPEEVFNDVAVTALAGPTVTEVGGPTSRHAGGCDKAIWPHPVTVAPDRSGDREGAAGEVEGGAVCGDPAGSAAGWVVDPGAGGEASGASAGGAAGVGQCGAAAA